MLLEAITGHALPGLEVKSAIHELQLLSGTTNGPKSVGTLAGHNDFFST
jgi:hypothetical protein